MRPLRSPLRVLGPLPLAAAALSAAVVLLTRGGKTEPARPRPLLSHAAVRWEVPPQTNRPLWCGVYEPGRRYVPGNVVVALHPLRPEGALYLMIDDGSAWAPIECQPMTDEER